MEYVRFGKTGRTVSRIGFGGAPAGIKNYMNSYDPADASARRTVCAALEKALELGVTYYDTAPSYGGGASEEIYGEVLGSINPADIFLATKCAPTGYDGVMRSFELSLKRLRRDYVDLFQIHGSSYTDETAADISGQRGMLAAMEELKRGRAVRHIGFTSEDNNGAVFDFIKSGRFDTAQICYNFLFQHPYEPSRPFGALYELEKADMGTVVMRTLTSGTFQKFIRMVNPDNTFDYTPALLQFVLSNPLVDVALAGMMSPEQVELNVKIINDKEKRIDLNELHNRFV